MTTKQTILSVKSGHTGPDHLRDLRGVIDREKAEIGVLITLEKPTKQMRTEAASAAFTKHHGAIMSVSKYLSNSTPTY